VTSQEEADAHPLPNACFRVPPLCVETIRLRSRGGIHRFMETRVSRRILSVIFMMAISALLVGCNAPAGYDVRGGKLCKLGVDGRCYHVGDEWTMYRFGNKPHRAHVLHKR
jgi:hypothetical protein